MKQVKNVFGVIRDFQKTINSNAKFAFMLKNLCFDMESIEHVFIRK